VGSDRKFCAALIFPTEDQVRAEAEARDLNPDRPFKELLRESAIIDAFRSMVVDANEGLDHWSTVKRFALVPDELTIESGLLTPTLKVKRPEVRKTYTEEIESLYHEDGPPDEPTPRGAVVAEVE
jgi:long-chain acyl-CoA synthetase